ncbi:MAG: mycothiol synthase [Acidimicrobiales bacterium]
MVFEVVHSLAPDAVEAVEALAARTAASEGHAGVDRHRLELATSGRAPGLVAALAWDAEHRHLGAYAQAVRGRGGWDVERLVAAGPPGERSDLALRLLRAALGALALENGTDVRLWIYQATDDDDRLAGVLGLHPARELWQMRRPLPVEDAAERDLPTRPFEVGRDEQAWLTVNNRAFGWHPEQSGWALADLQAREREAWFDPAGFLLHESAGRLVGFCWTKVHRDVEPALGEIYVIAVDPNWSGHGLGRALTLAGLDHLAAEGLTVGMLYVEATNTPAVRLYEDLGFTVDHVDRVYRSLAPTG